MDIKNADNTFEDMRPATVRIGELTAGLKIVAISDYTEAMRKNGDPREGLLKEHPDLDKSGDCLIHLSDGSTININIGKFGISTSPPGVYPAPCLDA